MTIREFRVLGESLREIHADAETIGTHMAVAHHRRAHVDAPNFGIRKSFFEGDGQLTDTAAHVEDAFHLTVGGQG